MSKYNLIDIFEQYQIGSGWTNDFDYDGMLNAGLNVSVDTNIETLKKVFEDFTDVNYHREAEHLHYAIEAIEGGDMFEAEGKLNDFFAEIRKTQGDQGMDTSDDLGAYMASKMDENEAVDLAIEASQEKAGIEVEESFDSLAKKLDKQKGITKKEAGKIAGSIAAKKRAGAGKGPTAKQKKRMSEADAIPTSAGKMKRGDDGKMYNVIASNAKRKMAMRSVIDILRDELSVSQEDAFDYIKTHRDDLFDGTVDAFDRDDVVDDYKNYESVNEASDTLQEKQYAPEVVDRIEMVRKVLWGTNNFNAKEIEAYTRSLIGDFEKGDFEAYDDYKANDYVEDIKNFISDKALQEHFGRFMKDYQ